MLLQTIYIQVWNIRITDHCTFQNRKIRNGVISVTFLKYADHIVSPVLSSGFFFLRTYLWQETCLGRVVYKRRTCFRPLSVSDEAAWGPFLYGRDKQLFTACIYPPAVWRPRTGRHIAETRPGIPNDRNFPARSSIHADDKHHASHLHNRKKHDRLSNGANPTGSGLKYQDYRPLYLPEPEDTERGRCCRQV